MEAREPVYKSFRPAWRSFYKSFLLMIILIVLAGCAGHFVPYFQENPAMSKWLWIAVIIIDVLLFLTIAVKRATMTLLLKDNPDKPDDQEVDFSVCHPSRPFSSDFRESIQIGFQNIVDIKVGQTAIQTLMNIGDIVITSSGTGQAEIRAKDIYAPDAVRNEIQVHIGYYR